MRKPRRPWRLVAAAALLAGAFGHYAYWYSPREHEGTPAASGRVAALLADSSFAYRLWLPYPHQNLGVLADEVGDLSAWTVAAARLLGAPPPRLPRFGPFPFPPARELAIAVDPRGERLSVVLATYPVVGVLARLAGSLAGNPWLGGGEVSLGARPGRSAVVAWEGTTWTLTAGAPAATEGGFGEAGVDALGHLIASADLGWLPAGVYRVERVDDGLWLAEAAPPAGLRSRLHRLEEPGLALALAEGQLGDGARALAAWAPERSGEEHAPGVLPALASLVRAPAERWPLPGEAFFALAGRKLPRRDSGLWAAVAYESRVVEKALPLAADLEGVRSSLLPTTGGRLVWASPSRLVAAAGGVADLLTQIPLLGAGESGRWRDLQVVLAPFAGCREMAAVLPARTSARLAGISAERGFGAPPALLLCGSDPAESASR